LNNLKELGLKKVVKINLKSFKFSSKSKKGAVPLSDGGELGKMPIAEKFFGIMKVSLENILIKMVFGGEKLEFLNFLFLQFHGCVQNGQAEVSGFLFAELEFDEAHFQDKISKAHDEFRDVVLFTLDLEESES
jgi:hypothetical protein